MAPTAGHWTSAPRIPATPAQGVGTPAPKDDAGRPRPPSSWRSRWLARPYSGVCSVVAIIDQRCTHPRAAVHKVARGRVDAGLLAGRQHGGVLLERTRRRQPGHLRKDDRFRRTTPADERPEFRHGPIFSPDGRRIAFSRFIETRRDSVRQSILFRRSAARKSASPRGGQATGRQTASLWSSASWKRESESSRWWM